MSISDITPAAVLAAVEAGCTDLPSLAARFEVLPTFRFLIDALRVLEADGMVACTVQPTRGTTFTSTRLISITKEN